MDRSWTWKGDCMTILDLAQKTGIYPKWVAGTSGGVYHSPCPICGGKDRFYIQPYKQMSKCMGSYRCRQCGIYGDSIQFARQFLNLSYQEAAKEVNATIPEQSLPSLHKAYPQAIILKKPSDLWITKASEFIEHAHKKLLCKTDSLKYLETRGLPLQAVQRYKIGWSDKNEFFSRNDWGLDKQISTGGKQRLLWIPKGLVIPTFQSNCEIIRLKVRRADYKQDDQLPKYVAISGSMNGLNIIGSSKNKVMVVVESELDAYAIDYAAHDLVIAVAVGSNIKNPDNVTDQLARNSEHLLICYDNDEAGKKMLIKWQKLYRHAKACPTPIAKDIGEAIQNGLTVKEWILEKITK